MNHFLKQLYIAVFFSVNTMIYSYHHGNPIGEELFEYCTSRVDTSLY